MKITKPKKQLFTSSMIYYVTSDSGGDRHIVTFNRGTLYCDCRDFIARRLPLLGTSSFSLCKHGTYVRYHTVGPKSKKRFGVYFRLEGTAIRSEDYPREYRTKKAAERAAKIDSNTFRFVREIV